MNELDFDAKYWMCIHVQLAPRIVLGLRLCSDARSFCSSPGCCFRRLPGFSLAWPAIARGLWPALSLVVRVEQASGGGVFLGSAITGDCEEAGAEMVEVDLSNNTADAGAGVFVDAVACPRAASNTRLVRHLTWKGLPLKWWRRDSLAMPCFPVVGQDRV